MRATGLPFLAVWLIAIGIHCWFLTFPGGDFRAAIVLILICVCYCALWLSRYVLAIGTGLFYRRAIKIALQPGWYLVLLFAAALSGLAASFDWPSARMWWYRKELDALAQLGTSRPGVVRAYTVSTGLGGPTGGEIAGMQVRQVGLLPNICGDASIHVVGEEGILLMRSLADSEGFVLWLGDSGAFFEEIGLVYVPEETLQAACAHSWRSLGNGWYQIRRSN